MWESMLGARRTTKQGTAGMAALRPVRLQAGQGCLVGAAIAKALYFHASVCVHAAMCLALTLGHAAV
jgi:hypothetical protein